MHGIHHCSLGVIGKDGLENTTEFVYLFAMLQSVDFFV